jgi:phytoene dehydrogenase-like protein
MEYEVVVIGAGIGGLTTAAVLAKRGLNVCLLERQSYAGGCAAVVEHAGHQFEPTHGLYCGWEPAGVFERLFSELAAPAPRARWLSTPYLVRMPDGLDVPRISNREDFGASLRATFPECADGAIEFYRDLTNPRLIKTQGLEHLGSCSRRFRGFIDIQLKTLAQRGSVACSPQLAASALDPRRSFWEIEGGVQALIDALVKSFKDSGGRLRLSSPVLRLAYGPDGSPIGVDLLNGERVAATRAIVSNLTIWDTYGKLIGPARTPRQISSALKGMRAPGSYQMFLTVAATVVPALAADRILLLTDFCDEESLGPEETQLSFYLSSDAEGKMSGTDRTAVVSAYTDAEDWFSFHEDLAAFEERDQSMLENVWTRLHSAMPELGAAADLIETATPQTFYENTRRRFGMIGSPTPSAPDSITAQPFPNLWLVGDTVTETFGAQEIVASALYAAHQIMS